MNIILLIGLFAAGILAASAVHQKRLVKASGIPREEFIEALANEGIPAEISGAVYDITNANRRQLRFQVSPDFSLTTVFRKSHDDVDDDVRQILGTLNLQLPPEAILRHWPNPLSTVRDVVDWVNWVKERQSSIPHST